jgi:uncharacterized membrane protein YeaQ/YmgE (transglycosylase-associated protein family)
LPHAEVVGRRAEYRFSPPGTVYIIWGVEPWHFEGLLAPDLGGNKEMSFLAWIVLGLIAGFIGSKVVNKRGEGLLLDIVLGIIGAIAGGWLFNQFGAAGVTGLNLYSLLVAVVGAVVVLLIYHAVRRAA